MGYAHLNDYEAYYLAFKFKYLIEIGSSDVTGNKNSNYDLNIDQPLAERQTLPDHPNDRNDPRCSPVHLCED